MTFLVTVSSSSSIYWAPAVCSPCLQSAPRHAGAAGHLDAGRTGQSGSHSAAQAGPEFMLILLPPPQVLGVQVGATMPSLCHCLALSVAMCDLGADSGEHRIPEDEARGRRQGTSGDQRTPEHRQASSAPAPRCPVLPQPGLQPRVLPQAYLL